MTLPARSLQVGSGLERLAMLVLCSWISDSICAVYEQADVLYIFTLQICDLYRADPKKGAILSSKRPVLVSCTLAGGPSPVSAP